MQADGGVIAAVWDGQWKDKTCADCDHVVLVHGQEVCGRVGYLAEKARKVCAGRWYVDRAAMDRACR